MSRDDYMTVGDVAGRLGVSPRTVHRWAKEGLLASGRTLGHHLRFDPEEVERVRQQMTAQQPESTRS
jgi:excisionase family DNA binding protein